MLTTGRKFKFGDAMKLLHDLMLSLKIIIGDMIGLRVVNLIRSGELRCLYDSITESFCRLCQFSLFHNTFNYSANSIVLLFSSLNDLRNKYITNNHWLLRVKIFFFCRL